MNDELESLEVELAALQPRGISPRLRDRIARRLAQAPRRETSQPRWFAHSAAVAAACVVAAVFLHVGDRGDRPGQNVGSRRPVPHVEVMPPAATLLAYERALARSPEELEARMSAFRWPVRDASSARGRGPAAVVIE